MKRLYALVLIPLIALSGIGCGDEEEEGNSVHELSSALEVNNALNPNALNPNALNPNGLRPIALTLSALSPGTLTPEALTAIREPGSIGDLSREHLKYTVGCALEPTQSFNFSWTDLTGQVHPETYWGLLGLAPGWQSTPPSSDEKRWISACLAARTNYYSVSVTISSRGPCKALKKAHMPEATTYPSEEGAFWGNLYEGAGAVYSCHQPSNNAHSRTLLRECAAGHVDMSTGAVQPCSGVQRLGACDIHCAPLTSNGMHHPSCFSDPANMSATTSLQPITVFLEP